MYRWPRFFVSWAFQRHAHNDFHTCADAGLHMFCYVRAKEHWSGALSVWRLLRSVAALPLQVWLSHQFMSNKSCICTCICLFFMCVIVIALWYFIVQQWKCIASFMNVSFVEAPMMTDFIRASNEAEILSNTKPCISEEQHVGPECVRFIQVSKHIGPECARFMQVSKALAHPASWKQVCCLRSSDLIIVYWIDMYCCVLMCKLVWWLV